MTINSNWIDSLRGDRDPNMTLHQAADVEAMIVGGELVHVQGAFVAALTALANEGCTEVNGAQIDRCTDDRGDWVVACGPLWTCFDDAAEAVCAAMSGPRDTEWRFAFDQGRAA